MDIDHVVFVEPGRAILERCSIEIEKKAHCVIEHEYTLISPGTEVALFSGTHIGFSDPDIPWARYPLKPGYAAVGRVVEAADGCVLGIGERILYYGPHASHGVLDTDSMIWAKLPDVGDPLPYLFTRFAQIAYSAVVALHRAPRNAIVYGAGIVGNLCAQLFSALPGIEEVGILDLSERRLAVAAECGISGASSARELSFTADTIVEATGAPAVVNEALKVIDTRGQLILLGSSRGTVEVNFYKLVHRKLVSIIGAHETILPVKESDLKNRAPQARWASQQEAVDGLLGMITDGRLRVRPFIQTVVSPAEVQQALQNLLEKPNEYLGTFIRWR